MVGVSFFGEVNEMYAAERDEVRSALRWPSRGGSCEPGRHDMRSDGLGGGSCSSCGLTVGRDEV